MKYARGRSVRKRCFLLEIVTAINPPQSRDRKGAVADCGTRRSTLIEMTARTRSLTVAALITRRDHNRTTDCIPETSKRLRQRAFLQKATSSLRTIYGRALANRARSSELARGGADAFFWRTI